jgi:hypothetical protein
MDSAVLEIAGRRVLICAPAGAVLAKPGDANDFLAEAWAREADMLAILTARLGEDFFDLRSGLAGEVGQKFANYRMPLVIIGDLWFVADRAELIEKCRRAESGSS